MKKLKNIFTVLLSLLVLLGAISFSACSESEPEDQKYDVTIKIKNSLGDEWIFTPDISELYYEYEYTGEEISFWVDSYNLPDHPYWSDNWFDTKRSGPNVFEGDILYTAPDGTQLVTHHKAKEKGLYYINYYACSTSTIWKFRSIHLILTIR
ncbi:MAG: hypothetical protein E7370_03520 [Clostridiales bacterium]|nr:hypothetical protein [Clostridiales bacterium]